MEIIDYKIKSEYIKNKIRGQSFKNTEIRDYIEDLVFLEESITKGIHGWAGNKKLFGLKERYEKEYEEIYRELKPDEYKKYPKKKKLKRLFLRHYLIHLFDLIF